jgi:hypothetical protein
VKTKKTKKTTMPQELRAYFEQSLTMPSHKGSLKGYALPLPKLLAEADRCDKELDDCDFSERERLTELARSLMSMRAVCRN